MEWRKHHIIPLYNKRKNQIYPYLLKAYHSLFSVRKIFFELRITRFINDGEEWCIYAGGR